jgi:hypothetical protein
MASYRDAIDWIALNDDTDFLDDTEVDALSVTASMVADLWGKDEKTVKADLRRALKRHARTRASL